MVNLGDISIIELQLDDATSLNKMLLNNSKRFQRFFPKTLEENLNMKMTQEYILNKKSLIANKKEYTLGIKNNASNNVIGLIIIKNINRELEDGELAYCIDVDFGGQGRMTKTVEQICNFAYDKIKLKSLYVLTHKTNVPSVRVTEKTGFIWIETKLKSHTPPGESALDMEKFVKML